MWCVMRGGLPPPHTHLTPCSIQQLCYIHPVSCVIRFRVRVRVMVRVLGLGFCVRISVRVSITGSVSYLNRPN